MNNTDNPPVLVLSPRYTPDSNQLWQAALRANWSTARLQSHRVPEWLKSEAKIVLYGEGLFVAVVAEQLGITLLSSPPEWLPQLPTAYLLRQVTLITLGEARSVNKPTFIKPAADKAFDARIYQTGSELPSSEYLDDATAVLVSEPVEWDVEFRFFIADRKILTYSPYSRAGNLIVNEDDEWLASADEIENAIHFVEQLLQDMTIAIPPALVLDVGKIVNRGWAVVETNPAWASGIYGCDPDKVLEVLAKSCLK